MSEQDLIQRVEYLERYVRTLTNRVSKLEEGLKYGQVQYPHGPVFAELYDRLAKVESMMKPVSNDIVYAGDAERAEYERFMQDERLNNADEDARIF